MVNATAWHDPTRDSHSRVEVGYRRSAPIANLSLNPIQ
jgi:hypothetical protein